jgi:hypothetical protein
VVAGFTLSGAGLEVTAVCAGSQPHSAAAASNPQTLLLEKVIVVPFPLASA